MTSEHKRRKFDEVSIKFYWELPVNLSQLTHMHEQKNPRLLAAREAKLQGT